MWKEKKPPNFNIEWLCHPWYWELSFCFKYLKERGWEKSDRLLRNWCQKGKIKAVKVEDLKSRKVWMVEKKTIIKLAKEMDDLCQDTKID